MSESRRGRGRFWHILRHNKNTERVQQAIWVDTETHQERVDETTVKHVLDFGWAAYRKINRHGNWSEAEWFRFDRLADFWHWVESHCRSKTKLWVCCHNTNFDLPVLDCLRYLPSQGWSLKTAILDGPPTILTYARDKRTICLWDTLNIWRCSLKKLGESVGLQKLEMPAKEAGQHEWDLYAHRDVEIIMAACLQWWGWLVANDMGGWTPTVASQSMRAYRHRFMQHPILIDNHKGALALARFSYHGGRTECGYIGAKDGDFFLLDVNSMYPYVMRENLFPAKIAGYLTNCYGIDLRGYLDRFACVAEVDLNTPEAFAAVVDKDKLIFPIGRFTTVLTSPELRWAIAHRAVKRVHRLAFYQQAPLFRQFVDELYSCRMAAVNRGDHVTADHFKLLLNSFYGKWGQNGRKWKTIGSCDPADIEVIHNIDAPSGQVQTYRKVGGVMQSLQVEGESFESHPAIAAHITAYARMELFNLIRKVGPKHYFYCDTDSILTDASGVNALADRIDKFRLGGLKVVGQYRHIEIYGPKDYVFDDKVVTKGIRQNARKIREGVYEQERWSSLRGLIRLNSLDAPRTSVITKSLSRLYTKGTVAHDGFVLPISLPR